MDYNNLGDLLEFYKKNYTSISKHEIYKWKAVKKFQARWNFEDTNFANMLAESLSDTGNLLDSKNAYPKKAILNFAEIKPNQMREAFRIIFNEEINIITRIREFKKIASEILAEKEFEGSNNHYQDHKAISVYLTLRYP